MSWQAVIFDCDGVLVDSEPIANRVFMAMLAEIGLPMSCEETLETFMGLSMPACLQIIEKKLGKHAPESFLDELQARTFAAFERELKPVRGVPAILDRLPWVCVIASSGSHEKMAVTLELTGLKERFSGRIFSAQDVARGKPFPDLYLYAATRLQADPAYCAVVEDSVAGVKAGIMAGMKVFGYTALTPAEKLAAAGAIVFDDMQSLPALLHQAASG